MVKAKFEYLGKRDGVMTWQCVSGYTSYWGKLIIPGSTISFSPEWFWRLQKD